MTYEEEKKIIDAAKVLMEYGKSRVNGKRMFACPGCLFQRINEGGCRLKSCPCDWTIPTVTRWTPEDVALAKALKGFGANKIFRNTRGDLFCITKDRYDKIGIPAFINLETGENIFIDTIIKEAEG